MADFTVRFSSGVSYAPWTDPATPFEPSRVNARSWRPLRRAMGVVGAPIVMTATVDGADGPPDGDLGGRLFVTFLVEGPITSPYLLQQDPGQSSVQWFTPPLRGHYTIRWRRPQGGLWLLHVDVDA